MKRKLFIGILISGIFLFLALRNIHWNVLWSVLERTRFQYVLLTVVFTLLGHFFRAFRWKFMLQPVKHIRMSGLFAATSIGFMANNLLPARLGELVRAHAIGKSEGISRTTSFATIVYERVIDVFSLVILLWITLKNVSGPEWLQSGATWILSINILLFVVMFLMERYQARTEAIIIALVNPLPERIRARALTITASFIRGLSVVGRVRTLLPIALASILVWFCAVLGIYYCFEALDMSLTLLASVTMIVFVSMGAMIPSAPAYLGTVQYACIVGLAIYNIDKTEALAFSLLYHATQFFPITLLGLFFWTKSQLRFDTIASQEDMGSAG